MKAKFLTLLFMLLTTSCVTNTAEDSFIDSLRTDGVYEKNKVGKNGTKTYIRFYISEDGKKYFKVLNMKKFSMDRLESNSQVVNVFGVNLKREQLTYGFYRGKLHLNMAIGINKFLFIPDSNN